MKKKCLLFSLVLILCSTAAISQVTAPTGGGKLAIGYDGTDVVLGSGSKVTTWNDQVGSYNATAVTSHIFTCGNFLP